MSRFNMRCELPVTPPYRLDLTAEALRRLAANVVDVVEDGAYFRSIDLDDRQTLVRVRQRSEYALTVEASAVGDEWVIPVVERMLGTHVDLRSWYRTSAKIHWLGRLASELRGLRPPRYPSLWEACAHAIVFQQISIHAAASIMRRFVEMLGVPAAGMALFAFPRPQAVLDASPHQLRTVGLSQNKVMHLQSAAAAIAGGAVREAELEKLDTESAMERLVQIRGIGRWSAAVIMLRGMGRLDVFPMNDSGAARSVKLLSGDPSPDLDATLATLGPTRGMLYYHLLLGRLRNLGPADPG